MTEEIVENTTEKTAGQRLIDLITGDDEVMVGGDLVINNGPKERPSSDPPDKKTNPWQSFLVALAIGLAGLAIGLGIAGLFNRPDPNYGEFELLPPTGTSKESNIDE